MRDFPAQTGPGGEPVSDSGSLTSSNANDVIQEEQNAITSSGQTLIPLADPANNTQLSQAMARYASGGKFGVDSGAADAYVISATGTFTPPDAYFDGMEISFYAINASTGASTVNAYSIGVVDLVQEDGTALTTDFIDTIVLTKATYDSGAGKFFVNQAAGVDAVSTASFSGFINGLITSNNAIDALKDIDIADGSCRDATNTENMVLASALGKRLDATWTVGGTPAATVGGLDTGSIAADSWYYIWLIKRTDTGVVDALFSLSSTAPTMPTNYDKKRLIAAVLTDATPDIIAYYQYGGQFIWDVLVEDVSGVGDSAGALVTLSIPVIQCNANLGLYLTDAATKQYLVTSPDQTNTAPSSSLFDIQVNAGATAGNASTNIPTNTGQVRHRTSAAVTSARIYTRGWTIDREII